MPRYILILFSLLVLSSCFKEMDDAVRHPNGWTNQNYFVGNDEDNPVASDTSKIYRSNGDTLIVIVKDSTVLWNDSYITYRVTDTLKIELGDTLQFCIPDTTMILSPIVPATDTTDNQGNADTTSDKTNNNQGNADTTSDQNTINDNTETGPFTISYYLDGEMVDSYEFNLNDTVTISDCDIHLIGQKVYWKGYLNGLYRTFMVGCSYVPNHSLELECYFYYGLYVRELDEYLSEVQADENGYTLWKVDILDTHSDNFDSIKAFVDEMPFQIKLTLKGDYSKIPDNAFGDDSKSDYKIYYLEICDGSVIGDEAFAGLRRLKTLKLPSYLREIGDKAFYYCDDLGSVTFPSYLNKIGSKAFYECRDLTEITIPSSVSKIGSGAFSYCSSLKKVTMNGAPPTLGDSYVFHTNNSSTTIYVPEKYLTKYQSATYWKNLKLVSY